jgi:hypothetical protein
MNYGAGVRNGSTSRPPRHRLRCRFQDVRALPVRPSEPTGRAKWIQSSCRHLWGRCSQGLDLAAAVGPAVGTDVVWPLRLMTDRTFVHSRHFKAVLSPALVAARARLSSLWNCHGRPRSIATSPTEQPSAPARMLRGSGDRVKRARCCLRRQRAPTPAARPPPGRGGWSARPEAGG